MLLLTQYKAMSLDRHINLGWRHYFNRELGEFIDVVPPQQRIDEQWYQGTADAVYQNIYVLEKERPEYVVILAGDHIYKMNYKSMVQYHMEIGADVTVGALRVNPIEARAVRRDGDRHQRSGSSALRRRSPNPKTIPGDPAALPRLDGHLRLHRPVPVRAALPRRDQARQPARFRPRHHSLADRDAQGLSPFRSATRTARPTPTGATWARSTPITKPTWTWSASIRCSTCTTRSGRSARSSRTCRRRSSCSAAAAKRTAPAGRWTASSARGRSSPAAWSSGASSARGCRVNSYSHVEDSILFEGVDVGRHAQIRRAIIDKGVKVPPGMQIGYDLELDRRRGLTDQRRRHRRHRQGRRPGAHGRLKIDPPPARFISQARSAPRQRLLPLRNPMLLAGNRRAGAARGCRIDKIGCTARCCQRAGKWQDSAGAISVTTGLASNCGSECRAGKLLGTAFARRGFPDVRVCHSVHTRAASRESAGPKPYKPPNPFIFALECGFCSLT